MMGFIWEVLLGFVVRIEGEFVGAWRRGGAFCKGIICTDRRRGVPFVRTKGTKIRLGLCPKTPLTLKLRLDTDWTFQR